MGVDSKQLKILKNSRYFPKLNTVLNVKNSSTLLYLIRDLGRLFISENFPLLVGLITKWSLIFSMDFILLVVYYIVVADQDVIVDDKSAIQSRSAITQRVSKQ